MTDSLKELLEQVRDENSFVRFIAALGQDWELAMAEERRVASSTTGPGARGWRHFDMGPFLKASVAWAEAADHPIWGYSKSDNPWRRAADVLIAGKFYDQVGT